MIYYESELNPRLIEKKVEYFKTICGPLELNHDNVRKHFDKLIKKDFRLDKKRIPEIKEAIKNLSGTVKDLAEKELGIILDDLT